MKKEHSEIPEEESKLILYTTDDGKAQVSLMSRDGRIWLNQKQMAELFAVTKMNISLHIANILQYVADVPGHATQLVRLFPRENGRLADGVKDIRMNGFYRRFENLRPLDKPGYKAPKGYPCADCPKNRTKGTKQ